LEGAGVEEFECLEAFPSLSASSSRWRFILNFLSSRSCIQSSSAIDTYLSKKFRKLKMQPLQDNRAGFRIQSVQSSQLM
jgi:hypothetical protein